MTYAYVAAGVAAAALYEVGPLSGNPYLFEAIGLSVVVAIITGLVRHRPSNPYPWLLFALAQLFFVAGDFAYYSLDLDFPAFGDGLYLAFYPLQAAGLVLLIRSRSPGRDVASLLDASIITVGVGVLAWVMLIQPYAEQAGLGAAERLISIAYPLMDVLLMAVTLRLVIIAGPRPVAFWLLGAGILCLVVTDSVYGFIQLHGVYEEGSTLDLGWIATYLLWGAAALHPSMRGVPDRAPEPRPRLSANWLALLTAAALIAPVVLILRSPEVDGGRHLPVVEVAAAVLFLLVLFRMNGLLASLRTAVGRHQQAEEREIVLRQAAAALASAPDQADIEGSVRAAAAALGQGLSGLEVDVELYPGPRHHRIPGPSRPAEYGSHRVPELLVAIPIETSSAAYGLIVAAATEQLPPLFVEGLITLGAQTALALESANLSGVVSHQRSEARVAALVKHSSDVVMVLDEDLSIRYVTPSASRVLGYRDTQLVGRPFTDLLEAGDLARAAALRSGFAANPEGSRTEWRMLHGDGHWMDVESVSNDLLGHPHVNGIVVTTRDVSERKALEEGLKSQVRKLQELDRLKDDFVATVSHELRTPLASIIGDTEMLADGDFGELSANQHRAVEVIDRNGHRLLSLIEDLLTLNHIESGGFGLRLVETPLECLLSGVERAVAPTAAKRGMTIDVRVDGDLGNAVIDAEQLDRALVNLVTNAVKFSPVGGSVQVKAQRVAGDVVFTVADHGAGIPEAEQSRLFTRFFRSSNAAEMAVQGTGLGLCIVKRIVEEHSGTIAIDSQVGVGTVVTMTIPIAVAATPSPVARESRPVSLAGGSRQPSSLTSTPGTK